MIGRKIASALTAALVMVMLCQIAALGDEVSGLNVTPNEATSNSIYTFEVNYQDSGDSQHPDGHYPPGEPDVLEVHPGIGAWITAEAARPVHLYGATSEDQESHVVDATLDATTGEVTAATVTVTNAPLRAVVGVWADLEDLPTPAAPFGNVETNLAIGIVTASPGVIDLDPTKVEMDDSTDPPTAPTVYCVYYAQKGVLDRVLLSQVPGEVAGVWADEAHTSMNYYLPSPPGYIRYMYDEDSDTCAAEVMLATPFPDTDPEAFVYVDYAPIDLSTVRFQTWWPTRDYFVCGLFDRADPDKTNLLEGDYTITGPDKDYWYTVHLAEPLKCWSNAGIDCKLYYRGYRVTEPVQCIRPDKPTTLDPYRTDKIAYLGRSRKMADDLGTNLGQVPVMRQGLIGLFDSPNPDPANDTNYAVGYNRYTGRVELAPDAEYGKVYWALYMLGPIKLSCLGKTLYMAEKDDGSSPRNGITYYVRASAGLDLGNKSDGVPGVTYHSGLAWDGREPPFGTPRPEMTASFYTLPSGGDCTDDTKDVKAPVPLVWSANNSIYPGYFTEHDVDDLQGKNVVVPFRVSYLYRRSSTTYSTDSNGVDGIFALAVDWENNGKLKIDYNTNYYTGGSYENDLSTSHCTIKPGTAIIRTEKIPIDPYIPDGLTSITLPLGYAEVIKDSAHFLGVYLNENGALNYYSGGSYAPGDLWNYDEPVITLGTPLPANTHEVWIKYVPRVMVQARPYDVEQLYAKSRVVTDPADYIFQSTPVMPKFGGNVVAVHGSGTRSYYGEDGLFSYTDYGDRNFLPLDPLVAEMPTTDAGRLPSSDPQNPGQLVVLRRNVLDPNNPNMTPEYPGARADDGTSSSAFVFRIEYDNVANLRPYAWLPGAATPMEAPFYIDDLHSGGVVLYLDEKGYGDYKPYFMARQNPKFPGTWPGGYNYDGGATFVFRVEPSEFWSSYWYAEGGAGFSIPRPFMLDNLYRSLLLGQYHYFFGASDDYIRDEDGDFYPNERIWVKNDIDYGYYYSYDESWWTEAPPYDPVLRKAVIHEQGTNKEIEVNVYNGYNYVDRNSLSPGNTDDYKFPAEEHPKVGAVLEPPVDLVGWNTAQSELVGSGYFLGTLSPYYDSINPAYAYPSHGETFGVVHHHFGFYTAVPGIWAGDGIMTSGSTISTEHTFSIKYKSSSGRAPSGGVWCYINNASSAGNSGRVRIGDIPNGRPSDPYVYVGYPMQPASEDADYTKGVIYVLKDMTLPVGPHTYYFEATDDSGTVRFPVRPDGRWIVGSIPTDDPGHLTHWFYEDPWVPGDGDYADNNDYCPGPYVNHKPKLANAKVTPNSGSQSTDFTFTVTYSDEDGDVADLATIDPGHVWGGPDYKGQRPYKADLVIEVDPKTHETRRVQMIKKDPSDVNYKDGTDYYFIGHLNPGEHRYYFEFQDDWGWPCDPTNPIPGEKVRYPEGDDTWLVGPVVNASAAPTLSNGSVESTDGTANSATLWKLSVDYADANNDPPTYNNVYIGEESVRLATLERTSVRKDANGDLNTIVVANPTVKQVAGIYDNPEGSGANLFQTNGGAVDPNMSGTITLETPLTSDGDVYVTYYYDSVEWDGGHEMVKSNPADNVYSDGVRYETMLRLGGARKQLLTPGTAEVLPDAQGHLTVVKVDPSIVGSIKGIYDNVDMDGIDYWTGQCVNEVEQIASFNPSTGTALVTVKHAPISEAATISVFGNPNGVGANHFASVVDAASGVIALKGIPVIEGTQNPAVTKVYVSYSTGQSTYDAATGTITLTTALPAGTAPYILYVGLARAYHFAFEASDGRDMAVYNTAIDPVTLQDSLWSGSVAGKSYAKKEDLTTVVPGRQYKTATKGMWLNGQWVQFQPVLIGGVPYLDSSNAKDVLGDPVLYKNEVPLVQQYEGVGRLEDGADATGKIIQLSPIQVLNEKAWRVDENHVQLRLGPIPDPATSNIEPVISVIDISDEKTRYLQPDGTVDPETGLVTLSSMPSPALPLPESEPVVLASYVIWGIPDPTETTIHGVSDVLGIYDNEQLEGFNYWTGSIDLEPQTVERLSGSGVRVKLDHQPVRKVTGVWDNTTKSGVNYLDRFDSQEAIVWLKDLPATVDQVYITYNTEAASYDRGLGKITLGSTLPQGMRTVWIEYGERADYRVNLLGDRDSHAPPSFIFNYTIPADNDNPGAWAGTVKADYWFGRMLQDKNGSGIGIGTNTPPKLTNGKLTPVTGDSKTSFTFLVDYTDVDGPNGQAPSYVRVVIDGVQHDMQPVVSGTPAYNAGATYKYTAMLSTGTHKYHFEASDGEGFAFLGGFGSTPVKIVDIPGPWVNDPPVLTDGAANPDPTDKALGIFDSVDFRVTYTDKDNDAPDAGTPWVWIDYNRFANDPNGGIHKAIVDELVGEDGTTNSRVRKIRFNRSAHDTASEESDELIRDEAAAGPWMVDKFKGCYLQIVEGKAKGRVYQIAYNNQDSVTVLADDIRDLVEVGDKFVIGPITMTKEDPTQLDFTNGVVYKVTVPRFAEHRDGYTYHFGASSTARVPDNVAEAAQIPVDERTVQSTARYPETGELQGAKIVPTIPPDVAPELYLDPGDVAVLPPPNQSAGGDYVFTITYKDGDGDAPTWRQDVPLLGYVRVIFGDGSYSEDMQQVDPNADYKKGAKFQISSNTVSPGTHTFYFEASDGWKVTRSQGYVVTVNTRPEFSDVAVTPPAGNMMAQFEYTATLKDAEGISLLNDPTTLTVYDPANPDRQIVLTVNNGLRRSGTDFKTGVVYSWSVRPYDLPSVFGAYPTSHSYAYKWTANDGTDDAIPATGNEPTINPNLNKPVLTFPVVQGEGQQPVVPMSGSTKNVFTFQVLYSDADGDAPLIVSGNSSTEGVQLVVDPSPISSSPKTIILTRSTTGPADYTKPVLYKATAQGSALPILAATGDRSGTHRLVFTASDGNADPSWTAKLTADGPTISQATVQLIPDRTDYTYVLGSSAVIDGYVNPKPSTGGASSVAVTVKRQDGTGWTQTKSIDSDGHFTVNFDPLPALDTSANRLGKRILDMTGKWKISAKWDGTTAAGPASTETTITVRCPDPYASYELRMNPGEKDMISSPLRWTNGASLAAMWEPADAIANMEISRYDPDTGSWIVYGQGYMPPFYGGEAYRVVPSPNFPVDEETGKKLLRPIGRLWYQGEPFAIHLRPGWNQFGSVFLRPIQFGDCLVSYQGQTQSLGTAASAGIIKDYAYVYDASIQDYRLISATRSGAIKTIEPYGGYMIFSNADCQLILQPGPATGTTAAAARSEAIQATQPLGGRPDNGYLETPPAE